MAEIWRRIGIAGGARIYSVLAGVVSLVITARVLGPEGRGYVASAITWAALFSTLGYFSLGQVALHRAANRNDETWLAEMLASLLLVTAVVSVTGWLVAAALYAGTDGDLYGGLPPLVLALGMLSLPALVWEQYGSSLLMAVDRLPLYNRAQVVGRTAGLLLLLALLLVFDTGVVGALCAVFATQAVVALGGMKNLLEQAGGRLRATRADLRSLITDGAKLHLNAIGSFLFLNASVLIVQFYRGPAETGQFQIAVQLVSVTLIVSQAASMVLYSEVARVGPDAAWAMNRRVLVYLSLGSVAAAVVGAALAPWVVPQVLGQDFASAVPVFQILTLSLVGQTFSSVMAPQWIGRGLFLEASGITLATGLLNLAACAVLVPPYGMQGAAIAALGVYGVSIAGNGAMAIWVQRRVSRRLEPLQATEPPAEVARS